MTSDPVNSRKLVHIRVLRQDTASDRCKSHFDRIHLTHRALPQLDWDEVDPSVTFLGKRLSFPLLISCMTGGDHNQLRAVNRNLAVAAQKEQVAVGVGSQRVMFAQAGARQSFTLRPFAPTVPLLANLGAIQLNNGMDIAACAEAIRVVEADALCLHLNPLQEAVQPEGDTNFGGLADRIGAVVKALEHPVIVKEVGAGLSPTDARLLVEQGVRYLDVAGAGGTSWSRVEHHRHADPQDSVGDLFADWGIPTPVALRDLAPLRDHGVTLIASGGIRSGVDMAKAVILGASLCGIAQPFLHAALQSSEHVVRLINRLRREFHTAMFLLGMRTAAQLHGNTDLIHGWEPDYEL